MDLSLSLFSRNIDSAKWSKRRVHCVQQSTRVPEVCQFRCALSFDMAGSKLKFHLFETRVHFHWRNGIQLLFNRVPNTFSVSYDFLSQLHNDISISGEISSNADARERNCERVICGNEKKLITFL